MFAGNPLVLIQPLAMDFTEFLGTLISEFLHERPHAFWYVLSLSKIDVSNKYKAQVTIPELCIY
ncbi:hypothetical protein MOB86_21110, partial [Bacillus haynesii]|uniref:hypothetical protein n=1 Tax=Bacillus haynesii TaxID=1925021 RepID=UPI0022800A74